MPRRSLFESSFSHIVKAPTVRVDIADWLLHLSSAEYRRCCPPDHIAAGASMTDDGLPTSINVEAIGDSLFVQQYIAEVVGPQRCRLVSTSSDVFGPLGRTQACVVWELSVEPLREDSCEYVNHIKATATDELPAILKPQDVDFLQASAALEKAAAAHNARETALFAASIERRALASRR